MSKWWHRTVHTEAVELSDIERHKEALDYFLDHLSSVGCYGGPGRLEAAKEAMYFFSTADLQPAPEPADD